MTRCSYQYDDYDFRPCAVPGWRVAYLDPKAPDLHHVWDMAGWLVQVEHRYAEPSGLDRDDRPLDQRPRQVVPAHMDGTGDLSDATESVNFWCVLGPTDPAPTREQAAAEHTSRLLRDQLGAVTIS